MLRFILGIIIGVVVIIFMVQNTDPVFVHFFGLTGSLPTAVILLIVFAVGIIRELIKPEWIEAIAGQNTVLGNFVGVVFGVFMYFPTLVEVPIAQMFLELGMHRGPLLAYLISDPELSLQSILITASIIGRLKAWVYVGWVSLFSTVAGLLYGAWVNGTSLGLVALYLLVFLGLLALYVWYAERRQDQAASVKT